jgi:signal transduction histidine kinase
VLTGSELWLLRLMADRGLALLDADAMLILIEEKGELRVAAASGAQTVRLRIVPVDGSALGELYRRGEPLAVDRPRGPDAAWLHELGVEARAALVEPLSMENQGGGMVVALRTGGGFRGPDRDALKAFATSVAQRLAAERSVEVERLRYGMEARERERTRWAREIHDESIQGMGALRLRLANARDIDDPAKLREAVDVVLDGLGNEIDGLRHLITELRPAALDDLGLAAALEALARRAQAIDGLDVKVDVGLDQDDGRRLDPELESTVYRIMQEALTNVSRHAEANSAVLRVGEQEGRIVASVTDDGKGMPGADRLGPRGDGLEGGFGMGGMRERAELVGGELEFGPAPERGTEVRLIVPLAGRPSAEDVRRAESPVDALSH